MQREDWVVLLGSALSGGQVGTSVCYPEVGEWGRGLASLSKWVWGIVGMWESPKSTALDWF